MRTLLQHVTQASVAVDGVVVGQICAGLVILLCAIHRDTDTEGEKLAAKITKLQFFRDSADKMNLSLHDIGGAALIASQFTLAAELRGNRPGFSTAAPPAEGKRLYDHFTAFLAAAGIPAANGIFGADMPVSLINDGPVTIWTDADTL